MWGQMAVELGGLLKSVYDLRGGFDSGCSSTECLLPGLSLSLLVYT